MISSLSLGPLHRTCRWIEAPSFDLPFSEKLTFRLWHRRLDWGGLSEALGGDCSRSPIKIQERLISNSFCTTNSKVMNINRHFQYFLKLTFLTSDLILKASFSCSWKVEESPLNVTVEGGKRALCSHPVSQAGYYVLIAYTTCHSFTYAGYLFSTSWWQQQFSAFKL